MRIIGFLLCIASVVLGAYVGVWLCFIGGIIQIIESLMLSPVALNGIAFGILRIILAGLSGWITFGVLFIMGWAMLDSSGRARQRSYQRGR